MRNVLIFITLFLLVLQNTFAKTAVTAKAQASVLQATLQKYSKAKTLQTEISKTDEKMILGTKSESKGSMLLEKNKIFISQNGEKKAEFYYNNGILTLVEFPDADFDKDGKRKVTTMTKNIPPFIKSLLDLFSNPKNFNKDFKVDSETTKDNEVVVQLKPVVLKNFKNFSLKLDAKQSQITELSFVDDVDTRTTIKFSNVQLNKKFKKETFSYAHQKTDEVMTE
jgi:outer membrane lipoprotein-sorting protein